MARLMAVFEDGLVLLSFLHGSPNKNNKTNNKKGKGKAFGLVSELWGSIITGMQAPKLIGISAAVQVKLFQAGCEEDSAACG